MHHADQSARFCSALLMMTDCLSAKCQGLWGSRLLLTGSPCCTKGLVQRAPTGTLKWAAAALVRLLPAALWSCCPSLLLLWLPAGSPWPRVSGCLTGTCPQGHCSMHGRQGRGGPAAGQCYVKMGNPGGRPDLSIGQLRMRVESVRALFWCASRVEHSESSWSAGEQSACLQFWIR